MFHASVAGERDGERERERGHGNFLRSKIHEMNISPSFVVGLGSLLLILVQRIHIASCFYIPRRSKNCMHNGLAIVPWLSSSRAPKKGMSPASAAADGNNSNYLKSSVADNNVAEETATLIAGP